MVKRKYSKEQFIDAVQNSFSIRETLLKLGLVAAGAGYRTFHRFVKEHQIDTSHFTGQLWSKGKRVGFKRPTEDYLTNKFPIQSFKLKNRLLYEGVLKHICIECKLTTWLGSPIPLELDHIDGNSDNNSLSNLRLLCPNCHTFTPTYRGKNIGKNKR